MSSALMTGVSGLRGVIGSSLTPEVCTKFAGAFGSWLVESAKGRPVTVVVGRDGRAGGAFVHHAATAGLLAAGVSVLDVGVSSTPTTAVMTDEMAARLTHHEGGEVVAGMELTASHNPQEWLGLKCLLRTESGLFGSSAAAPPAAIANQILERFRATGPTGKAWDKLRGVKTEEGGSLVHVRRVLEALGEAGVSEDPEGLGEGLNVVLDSVNSSGAAVGAMMLEGMNVQEILHIGCEETGVFPHTPEPIRENLSMLAESVRESEAHVGFAQDPDADRLAIIDERGHFIGEEYTLALSAMAILEAMRKRGEATEDVAMAVNLSTSRMIDDVAARYGARVIRTAVGEANVVSAMKEHGSSVGGEGNGGIIWPRVAYVRDSVAGMGLILSLLENGKRKLSEIVSGMPSYAIVKRKVDLASKDDARPAVEKLAKAYASERVDLQDGVRIDFESSRSWLHVRASNTEPIMRLIAEAPDEASAARVLAEAEKVIRG
ncbi:MAG: phosphoglucosamine mutase [Tepidisphaera sp.]